MLRFRLRELIADLQFREDRRVTLDEIAESTGIHRTTLSKIQNVKGYNTTTDVLNKLCDFFDCQIGDLVQRVSDDGGTDRRAANRRNP